uniref:Mitochondrial intermediate peptidase n=1 Tax=Lygus hesperus TaxID=30085 RepID=A0A146KM08_LYGHE
MLQSNFLQFLHNFQSCWLPSVTRNEVVDGCVYEASDVLRAVVGGAENGLQITLYPDIVHTILSRNPSAQVRRTVYVENCAQYRANLRTLAELALQRTKMARIQGYATYTESTLATELAQCPSNVVGLLEKLNATVLSDLRTFVRTTFQKPHRFPQTLFQWFQPVTEGDGALHPWDVPYYVQQLQHTLSTAATVPRELEVEYFSLRTLLEILQHICKHFFDIELRQVQPMVKPYAVRPSAHDGVSQWELRRTGDGQIFGTIYLDLLPRPHKTQNAATFTLVNGRLIPLWDLLHDIHSTTQHTLCTLVDGVERQHPTVVLCMNCSATVHGSTVLCCHQDLVTLLHEFGHT